MIDEPTVTLIAIAACLCLWLAIETVLAIGRANHRTKESAMPNGTEIAIEVCPICFSAKPTNEFADVAGLRLCQPCLSRGIGFAARASLGFLIRPAAPANPSEGKPLGERGAAPATPLTECSSASAASTVE